MKRESSSLRRWLSRPRRLQRRQIEEHVSIDPERADLPEEVAGEFTTEELQEFLEADRLDVKVNPTFKEQLRQKLWEIVRSLSTRSGPGPEDPN